MRDYALGAFLGVAIVLFLTAWATLFGGCASTDPRIGAYGIELQLCAQTVDASGTQAEKWARYDACRDEVRRRYGREAGP